MGAVAHTQISGFTCGIGGQGSGEGFDKQVTTTTKAASQDAPQLTPSGITTQQAENQHATTQKETTSTSLHTTQDLTPTSPSPAAHPPLCPRTGPRPRHVCTDEAGAPSGHETGLLAEVHAEVDGTQRVEEVLGHGAVTEVGLGVVRVRHGLSRRLDDNVVVAR